MNIIITGATGMVGSEVVRQALPDSAIDQLTLLTRRPSGFNHPKIRELIHTNFLDYSAHKNIFKTQDACIWCLGISQSRVSKSEYFTITYEYTVAAAHAMLSINPSMTFIFLSGQGADSKGKSIVRFARVKGQAENALLKLNHPHLYIFRPGGIEPTTRSAHEGGYKKFEITMVKLMGILFPWAVISTRQLSIAMLNTAKDGAPKTILGHRDIMKM